MRETHYDPYGDGEKDRPSFPPRYLQKSEDTGKQADNATWIDLEAKPEEPRELTYEELADRCGFRSDIDSALKH